MENNQNSETVSVAKGICPNCGAAVKPGQKFCGTCGSDVSFVTPEEKKPNFFAAHKKLCILVAAAVVVFAAIVVLIICLCGGGKKNFRDMYADLARNNWCEIGKDGSWMSLDTNPDNEDDYFGVDSIEAMDAIEKVNRELGFNDSVAQEMQQTRSIDGRQSASNDDYEITWSYHPDNGLEVLYKLK